MTRRSLVALLVLTAAASACQRAPAPLTDAQKTAIADSVKQADVQLFAALTAKDMTSMMSLYVPGNDVISADAGMIYPSRDSMEKSSRAFWGSLKSVTLARDQQRIAVLAPKAAVVTETWHGTFTDTAGKAMEMRGAYTAVWERRDDGWKILAENNSVPMPQPAPTPARKRR